MRRCAHMDVLFFNFGPVHIEAYGTLAIVVQAIIVGVFFLGRGLPRR
jgi:hypothetical protein